MKKIVGIIILTLLVVGMSAQTMKVQLKGVKYKVGGYLNVAIYTSEEAFLHEEHAVYIKRENVVGETHTFLVKDMPFKKYAIAVYHDENSDGELNTNFMKIPIEGYGFSNNPGFGMPAFNKSVFDFYTDKQEVIIEMRY